MRYQLELRDVSVAYDGAPAIGGVSLGVEPGAIGCLVGPSGCGKTSLLRAVAGFEPVATGDIRLGGRLVSRPGLSVPTERRRVGMVFQDFALFPHLDVAGNIGFGLRRAGAGARAARVRRLLDLIGLGAAGSAFPHQLSCGQQQRVALARALAPRPDILLMDEPFSSIDPELRGRLADEVRELLLREGVTAMLVTHDQDEAFAMADRIGVVGGGTLHQWDSPSRLYREPADRFVAEFVGHGLLIDGRVVEGGRVATELGVVAAGPHRLDVGTALRVLVRGPDLVPDDASPLRLPILKRTFRGPDYLYDLALPGGGEIRCRAPDGADDGGTLGVRLQVERPVVFPEDGKGLVLSGARVEAHPAPRPRERRPVQRVA
jgi:iron(III) transport system ATP-binding protein